MQCLSSGQVLSQSVMLFALPHVSVQTAFVSFCSLPSFRIRLLRSLLTRKAHTAGCFLLPTEQKNTTLHEELHNASFLNSVCKQKFTRCLRFELACAAPDLRGNWHFRANAYVHARQYRFPLCDLRAVALYRSRQTGAQAHFIHSTLFHSFRFWQAAST